MAKGKHAAALFEVIHAGKQMGIKEKARLLRTPKWWFKGRPIPEHEASAEESSGQASGARIEPAMQDPADPIATAPAPRTPGIDLKLDPDRQQITFRFSYTSAIVTSFALLVVVVLAYVIGRQMSRGPTAAMAGASTEQVRQGPARPDVLNIAPSGNAPQNREPDDAISQGNSAQPNPGASAPPFSATPGKRTIGLNYVIIQSYPDESSANDAVKVLAENGIAATVERSLRGYPEPWRTVVGTEGFPRIRAAEYENYLRKIQQISDKFANKKSFKAFQPLPYKWDRP